MWPQRAARTVRATSESEGFFTFSTNPSLVLVTAKLLSWILLSVIGSFSLENAVLSISGQSWVLETWSGVKHRPPDDLAQVNEELLVWNSVFSRAEQMSVWLRAEPGLVPSLGLNVKTVQILFKVQFHHLQVHAGNKLKVPPSHTGH